MIIWDKRFDCPVCLCPNARVVEKEGNDTWLTCIVCRYSVPGDFETMKRYGL